jgi:predicted glycosyltransferase
MNLIVDVTHPAHVHFFRHAIGEWEKRGHQVLIVARDKDLTLNLLEDYGYAYISLSKAQKGVSGFARELVEHEIRLFKLARQFKADIMMNIGGTFIVHPGKLLGIPAVVFTDTEHAKLSNGITFPFATRICTPDCYETDLGKKQVRYPGYHELAYLHPNRFTPDRRILDEIGIAHDEPFFIVRFVSWGAAHDVGLKGFSQEGKRELVQRLKEYGKIIITSEATLPAEFEPYRMSVSPTKIHDLLYYSRLFIGEGATMASEAAILGTPGIYVNPLYLGYLHEQEDKYGLVYNLLDERKAIDLALQLAGDPATKAEFQQRRERLLADKIDVTAWMVEYVENLIMR